MRGDIESGSFLVLDTRQGRACAALSLNRGREMTIARRMIAVAALVYEPWVAEDGNSLQRGFSVDAKPAAPIEEAKGEMTSQYRVGDKPN